MTKISKIFLAISMTFCLTTIAQTNTKNDSSRTISFYKQKDTSYWIDNFKQFREALYKNDKTKAKEFLDLPFQNEGNEIWFLAYSDNEKETDKLNENVKPFTEKDFDKYFNKIFTKELIKCFLKIKTNDLYKTGESESPEIKDSSTTYKLYVTFDKTKKTVNLNFATNTPYKVSDTEYDPRESNYIYEFQIYKNGHIKLKRVLIVG